MTHALPRAPGGPARTESARRLGYQPALDGLRGAAWVVVFAAHAGMLGTYAAGQTAMFVFFALSGFLITELLLEEHRATRSVSLRSFFARRALRLLPALGLFVAGWLAVVLATGGHAPWTGTVPGGGGGPGTQPMAAIEGAAAALAYAMNWAEIFHAFSSYVPIGHLWSLAVEEQFYLLWAPLAVALLRRGLAGWAAAALAVASFADVVVLHATAGIGLPLDMGTDTRAGAFLVGAALAVAWSSWPCLDVLARRWRLPALGASLSVMAFASWAFGHQTSPVELTTCWIAISLASGLLVATVLDPPGTTRDGLLRTRALTHLGRRSYALYLWHYVWLTWMRDLGATGVAVAFGASLACAEASWRLVERPALARKARFTPARDAPPGGGHEAPPARVGALAVADEPSPS